MRLPDGDRSRIILIGTANYPADPDLLDLPAVLNNLADVADAFGLPLHGWSTSQTCVTIANPGSNEELVDQLTELTAQAEDLLLIYFAGHGLLDSAGKLHLGLSRTRRGRQLRHTALPFDELREFVIDSPARKRVVILDCCFSGRAIDIMAPGDSLALDQIDIAGTFVLTATSASTTARAPHGERNTAFTAELVRLLTEGDENAPLDLTLGQLYQLLHQRLVSRGLPKPRRQGTDTVADLVIARNRSYRPATEGERWARREDSGQGTPRMLLDEEEFLGHNGDPDGAARKYGRIAGLLARLYGPEFVDAKAAEASRAVWAEFGTARTASPSAPAPPSVRRIRAVGIDLGTTNSVVSVLMDGEPRIVTNAEGTRSTPSVVAFAENGEVLVGEVAKRQAVANVDRTIRSVRHHMGTDWRIGIDGNDFTPQQISAFLLQKLKRDAEAYLGETITDAVISVPVHSSDAERQAVREAGEIAGLAVVRIVEGPAAAGTGYGADEESDQTVLVFDLGGGTLDVAVLETGSGVVEVKALGGDSHLGGDDWDQRVVDHLVRTFQAGHGVDLSKDEMAVQRLREAAEKAKIELSSSCETSIHLPYIAASAEDPLHLDEKLTRAQFQQLTADLLDRCKHPFDNVIKDAGIRLSEIDQVVLIGGSTRMPAVAGLVKELTGGKEPLGAADPDGAVAIGSVLEAGVLKGEVKDVLLLRVAPQSIGIRITDGTMNALIERNTTIPTRRSEIFTTAEDNQHSLRFKVYRGEHRNAADNELLGVFEMTGLPPAPRGLPQIEVTFDIDANGIMHASAKDLGTGKEQRMTVTGFSALPKDELTRMREQVERYLSPPSTPSPRQPSSSGSTHDRPDSPQPTTWPPQEHRRPTW
ncbi:hypothetical protein GCM10009665_28390 [Kitasatospora nipponensis]|uniref:Peptidase C14 caspase domain-containing protein n=1 Tax=Kitasatospora nipponensis TaxID=258049 RepID=A0ABP4GTI8_9ACTN